VHDESGDLLAMYERADSTTARAVVVLAGQ
jgi:hypothetical protein